MILNDLRVGRRKEICLLGCLIVVASHAFGQQSLSLHQAVQRALQGPASRIYAAQVEESRGGVRQAALRPNPRLYLSSEDIQPWNDRYSFVNNTEDYGYLQQTFEVAGKRGKRVDFATARLRQVEAQQAFRLQVIAGQVSAAYWSAASAQSVVVLLKQDLAAVDEMVVYNKNRVDAGAMRGIDLLRIEIERDRIRIAMLAAERDATLARVELLRLTGDPPATELRFSDSIEAVGAVPTVLLEAVLAQRADVRVAREALAAAEADLRLQQANGKPDVDLLGGYKRNSADDTAYGGLQILLPVSNRNQGEIQRARASISAAQASLDLLQQQVRADLEGAQQTYTRQREIVQQTLPDMRARAKQNLQVLTEAYRIGGVDLLRYLDAERTEIDVEVNALRTLTEFQQSALRLQLAYGMQP